MNDAVQDRPYQREFVAGNDRFPGVYGAWEAGSDAVLGMLPTGCGKTICAGLVAARARRDHGWRTLFLAHREELIRQAEDKLGRMGLTTAVEMANERSGDFGLFDHGRPDVTIATVQTLQGRRLAARPPGEFGVVITDEAHHARAKSYRNIYKHFRDYRHLGITATPDRGDKLNIGAVYDRVAFEYSLRQAIRDGWLCPITVVKLPCGVDLKDIRTTGGDYSQVDLEARIAPHVEALCDIILGEIGHRPTVIFCPDVGSAEAAADCLNKMASLRGPNPGAVAVSGRDTRVERKDHLAAFERGEVQILTCCDLLVEGWDCPKVACIVVMRPTKSRARYVQMIGRGTRPYGTLGQKPDCLILDFAWETTGAHELVTAIDLFDDSGLDDEVSEVAAGLLASGRERDPMKAIDEAERIVKQRTTVQVRLTGNRTAYRKIAYDPVGVGHLIGVPIKKGWDYNPDSPATPKQLDLLAYKGIDNPEGISKSGAGKLIDAIVKRQEAGLCTLKQVKYLVSLGVDLDAARAMKFAEAGSKITELTASRRGAVA